MKLWRLAAAATALLITGCTAVVPAGPTDLPVEPPLSLANSSWVVAAIRGEATLVDYQPTISFEATRMGGNGGCNHFGGQYTLDGMNLSFGEITMTAMLCTDHGRDQQETAFFQALGAVAALRFAQPNIELLDANRDVALLLTPVPPLNLAGTSWVLTGLIDGTAMRGVAEDHPFTVAFDAERISGQACNSFSGNYTLEDDRIAIGPLSSTRMACPTEELSQQEALLLEVLQTANTANAQYGSLELTAPDGRGLHFTKA